MIHFGRLARSEDVLFANVTDSRDAATRADRSTTLRDYGYVLRQGSKVGSGLKQLWIAAVDVSKLGAGDPSYPAFRIPFVSLTENCHRPFWADDVIGASDAGAPDAAVPDDGGGADGGACLPIDADCASGGTCCSGTFCLPSGTGYSCNPG